MEAANFYRICGQYIDVFVYVKACTEKPGVGEIQNMGESMRLAIRTKAPPINGAANGEVEECIACWLNVACSVCKIIQGHTSRYKTVCLPYSEVSVLFLQSFSGGVVKLN